MEIRQSKLIDMPQPVDGTIDDIEASIPDEITDTVLRSLVGIARRKDPLETSGDDRLDYILSKL